MINLRWNPPRNNKQWQSMLRPFLLLFPLLKHLLVDMLEASQGETNVTSISMDLVVT